MPNAKLAKRVYSLQNRIVRELNNAHIFLEQAQPLLVDAKATLAQSKSNADRRYYVPSVGRTKFAKRTDAELKAIYDHHIAVGLFEAFLVNSLSRFEAFLADVLREFFTHYPLRLAEKGRGVPPCPAISPKELVQAVDKNQLLQRLIGEHLTGVFHQRPDIYLPYTATLLGGKVDPSFLDYYEIAATRDLVVHNSRVVNNLYLEKARAKARGTLDQLLPVDQAYYYDALAKLKKVSGAVKRDVEKKFGNPNVSSREDR
jgi:hypothetical protein